MRIFISWSGKKSAAYGQALRDWLPSVLQYIKPYYTPDDIEKGAKWDSEIARELSESHFGLICLTRTNLTSPWIMFESGALSKKLDKSKVSPLLFDMAANDLQGPLVQFQATTFTKADFKKLISSINNEAGEVKLESNILSHVFDKWWPDLEKKIQEIQSTGEEEPSAKRPDRDLLEEVLSISRKLLQTRTPRGDLHPKAIEDLVEAYAYIYNAALKAEDHAILEHLQAMKKPIEYLLPRTAQTESIVRFSGYVQEMDFQNKIFDLLSDDDIPF